MGNCIKAIFHEEIKFDPLDEETSETDTSSSTLYSSARSDLTHSELSESFISSLQKADRILGED